MAGTTTKAIYTNHDFQKVGAIQNVQIHPLTTAQKTTLAGTLGAGHKGLTVFDTDLSQLQSWNGSTFVAGSSSQSGLTPKGNTTFNATEPAVKTLGDLYVFSNAGTNTWGGGSVAVQVGDQVYWDGTTWQFLQGNVIAASESVPGILAIATTSETNTGTDDAKAVTPLKLTGFRSTKKLAGVYFATGINLSADTPLTINHALGLQNRDAYLISVKVGNSAADFDNDSIDTNNCSITSNVAITGATVCVIGF